MFEYVEVFDISMWALMSMLMSMLFGTLTWVAPIIGKPNNVLSVLVSVVVAFVFVGCLSLFLIYVRSKGDIANKAFTEEWTKNGCYVYRYECGGKRKYDCEIRTLHKGKVLVGNEILPTYPTCEVK